MVSKQFLTAVLLWAFVAFATYERLQGQQPPNIVAPNGLMITVDGKMVGNFNSLTFTSGNGIVWTYLASGTGIQVSAGYNSATMVTKGVLQSGACTFLNSVNGTKAYTAALGATCQLLTSYSVGERFWLTADAPCAADCTINIDNVGIKNIKRSDGKADPGGLFDFTQGVPIRYDGTVFRIEWQH